MLVGCRGRVGRLGVEAGNKGMSPLAGCLLAGGALQQVQEFLFAALALGIGFRVNVRVSVRLNFSVSLTDMPVSVTDMPVSVTGMPVSNWLLTSWRGFQLANWQFNWLLTGTMSVNWHAS
eukprot:gene3389-biopygen1437